MPINRKPKAQSKYFYCADWSKDEDNAFINILAWQGNRGYKQTNPQRPNRISLDYAIGAVDHWSGKKIPASTYLKKLEALRIPYETFKRIISDPAFVWNPASNRVTAGTEDWKRLREAYPFAKAYFYRGEPKWDSLKAIFERGEEVGGSDDEVWQSDELAEASDEQSEHESDVAFLGENLGEDPEIVDLCSSDEGSDN